MKRPSGAASGRSPARTWQSQSMWTSRSCFASRSTGSSASAAHAGKLRDRPGCPRRHAPRDPRLPRRRRRCPRRTRRPGQSPGPPSRRGCGGLRVRRRWSTRRLETKRRRECVHRASRRRCASRCRRRAAERRRWWYRDRKGGCGDPRSRSDRWSSRGPVCGCHSWHPFWLSLARYWAKQNPLLGRGIRSVSALDSVSRRSDTRPALLGNGATATASASANSISHDAAFLHIEVRVAR